MPSETPQPREVLPDVWWLGDCLTVTFQGQPLHNGNWAFLIRGSDASMIVEGGAPLHVPNLQRQLAELLRGAPELRYIWASHQETPHAGGVGRLLAEYPSAQLVGDVRDYHFYFPQFEDRLRPLAAGESIDLGDTQLTIVEAVIRDLPTTQWAFDSRRRALFTSDGFAFSHLHSDGQCRKVTEEVPTLPIEELTGLFAELALEWTTVVDIEPYVERMQRLLDELGVETILPSHGLPILDVARTVPKVYEGIRLGSRGESSGVDYTKLT